MIVFIISELRFEIVQPWARLPPLERQEVLYFERSILLYSNLKIIYMLCNNYARIQLNQQQHLTPRFKSK